MNVQELQWPPAEKLVCDRNDWKPFVVGSTTQSATARVVSISIMRISTNGHDSLLQMPTTRRDDECKHAHAHTRTRMGVDQAPVDP